ncbi:hypothetical protein BAUCODRAFT_30478 [Baudoinia panamericana UAMH 10762]|uniref:Uncharacterized protein n=1 Tax=Baudoinia panamericana (strain UAMH 10762) TaxID=717646 RepID=M2NLL4_BAUPA|nr:uncharacterized protein BAUCODRAFT_30478 [Baudoinia panamericana UAMH 10762]EMD00031.1 hypothetical protein BAUCODRAFT_30478 [Baudoinia panamericana UAMH 10762]
MPSHLEHSSSAFPFRKLDCNIALRPKRTVFLAKSQSAKIATVIEQRTPCLHTP